MSNIEPAYTSRGMEDVDWVVVDLAVFGNRPDHMTVGERIEAARRLMAMGMSLSQISEKLKISEKTALRYTNAIKGWM